VGVCGGGADTGNGSTQHHSRQQVLQNDALQLLYCCFTSLLLLYCFTTAYEREFGRINTTSALLSLLQKLGASYAGSAGGNPQPFTFSCQHGWGECMGNALEACIQDVQPDYTKFLPVFDCIESRSCAGHSLY
jgi:hypothetical protein